MGQLQAGLEVAEEKLKNYEKALDYFVRSLKSCHNRLGQNQETFSGSDKLALDKLKGEFQEMHKLYDQFLQKMRNYKENLDQEEKRLQILINEQNDHQENKIGDRSQSGKTEVE